MSDIEKIRDDYNASDGKTEKAQRLLVEYFKQAYTLWLETFAKVEDLEDFTGIDVRLSEINTIILGFMDQIQRNRGAIYIDELAAVFIEILNYYQATAEAMNSPTQGQSINEA